MDRLEIPIEPAAAFRPTSRGFLPCRLSDDGPGARHRLVIGPSSETLHNSGRVAARREIVLLTRALAE
jgi:hypothetical protein